MSFQVPLLKFKKTIHQFAKIAIELRYNTIREITSGRNTGWYVKLINDQANSEGYYIYEFKTPDGNKGFDTWLESEIDVQDFIKESDWKIEWLN